MESAAEAQRLSEKRKRQIGKDAEKSGETILDLVMVDHESGLGGRFLVTLVKRNRTLQLPWSRLKAGSPVVISSDDDDSAALQGVVSARSAEAIQVAFNEFPHGTRFRLDLSPDEITRKRQLSAIADCRKARGRLAELRRILMCEIQPRFAKPAQIEFHLNLNHSQQEAVQFAMTAEEVAIIHGPPGTGKTTTLVELICQATKLGQSVLACAPSNTAVDNLLEKLVAAKQGVVRLGHPARVDSNLRDYTLEMAVINHENMKVVREMMREAEQLFRKAGRFTRAKPVRGAKQEMRREAKQLKSDARMLEQQAVDHVLDRAPVICATTTLDEDLLGSRQFDLLVIDEACQSTEPGCWIPIRFADKIVLAGDHCQLPPTVVSTEAARDGFSVSLMERMTDHFGDIITRQLKTQYRMHHKIMDFSSNRFYDNSLIADESVMHHRLCELDGIESMELTATPVTFIDSAGADWNEELEPEGESKLNPNEAQLVLRKVDAFMKAGVAPRDIAVIAPYAAQIRWLREQCQVPNLEIDTVDGFQGREKEVVLISLVRSNSQGEIGFLADTRRMNVAMTRARRSLTIVGDSATIGSNRFFSDLLAYLESIGAYHSVWEEEL